MEMLNFRCNTCNFASVSSRGLKSHKTKSHGEKTRRFPCDLCPTVFLTARNKFEHKRVVHKDVLAAHRTKNVHQSVKRALSPPFDAPWLFAEDPPPKMVHFGQVPSRQTGSDESTEEVPWPSFSVKIESSEDVVNVEFPEISSLERQMIQHPIGVQNNRYEIRRAILVSDGFCFNGSVLKEKMRLQHSPLVTPVLNQLTDVLWGRRFFTNYRVYCKRPPDMMTQELFEKYGVTRIEYEQSWTHPVDQEVVEKIGAENVQTLKRYCVAHFKRLVNNESVGLRASNIFDDGALPKRAPLSMQQQQATVLLTDGFAFNVAYLQANGVIDKSCTNVTEIMKKMKDVVCDIRSHQLTNNFRIYCKRPPEMMTDELLAKYGLTSDEYAQRWRKPLASEIVEKIDANEQKIKEYAEILFKRMVEMESMKVEESPIDAASLSVRKEKRILLTDGFGFNMQLLFLAGLFPRHFIESNLAAQMRDVLWSYRNFSHTNNYRVFCKRPPEQMTEALLTKYDVTLEEYTAAYQRPVLDALVEKIGTKSVEKLSTESKMYFDNYSENSAYGTETDEKTGDTSSSRFCRSSRFSTGPLDNRCLCNTVIVDRAEYDALKSELEKCKAEAKCKEDMLKESREELTLARIERKNMFERYDKLEKKYSEMEGARMIDGERCSSGAMKNLGGHVVQSASERREVFAEILSVVDEKLNAAAADQTGVYGEAVGKNVSDVLKEEIDKVVADVEQVKAECDVLRMEREKAKNELKMILKCFGRNCGGTEEKSMQVCMKEVRNEVEKSLVETRKYLFEETARKQAEVDDLNVQLNYKCQLVAELQSKLKRKEEKEEGVDKSAHIFSMI